MDGIIKYPRTRHIVGSRIQEGDRDLDAVPFAEIAGKHLVVEEKMDGANCAISFTGEGELRLQSRGHYLTGGMREKHFDILKAWAETQRRHLYGLLGDRYIMYGEWLYAKHTVFYDQLPHYFMEFDILDKKERLFLSTPRRMNMLSECPFIVSVRVLLEKTVGHIDELTALLGESAFISPQHRERLQAEAVARRLDVERVFRETDPSRDMEGLYIKTEVEGHVAERYKYVRKSFLASVINSESHWLNRPIIPNLLREGADIWE